MTYNHEEISKLKQELSEVGEIASRYMLMSHHLRKDNNDLEEKLLAVTKQLEEIREFVPTILQIAHPLPDSDRQALRDLGILLPTHKPATN